MPNIRPDLQAQRVSFWSDPLDVKLKEDQRVTLQEEHRPE